MAFCWFIGKAFYNTILLIVFVCLYNTIQSYELSLSWAITGIFTTLTIMWRCHNIGLVYFLTILHFMYSIAKFLCTSHRFEAYDFAKDGRDLILLHADAMREVMLTPPEMQVQNCK